MRQPKSGGGVHAILYTLKKAREAGPVRLWKAMRAKNACKTCAVGMGGQLGGMTNEERHFPELCKKSMQAMVGDMQGRIEPRFFESFPIEQLRAMSSRELEYCGRIGDPVVREAGGTRYRTLDWDEALDKIANALKAAAPTRTLFYASGRSSNEAGFLLQLLGRAHGTNHVTNCSYYCHSASSVGLRDALGASTATCRLEDLDKCDLLFLIGGNPASNHPRLISKLAQIRERGGKVIVVNPMRELGLEKFRVPSNVKSLLFGSEIASTYIQPVIGGDIAFLSGVAKSMIEVGAIDRGFIEKHTEGFEELERHLKRLSWDEIVRASGVEQAAIEGVARQYAASERTIFSWTMGITHHEYGVQNVRWIANLAFLRGMVGKEGAGLQPIRGHSNVQGMGSVGVRPEMSAAVLAKLEEKGIKAPAFKGYDTLEGLEAAARGEMDFALCLGGNLFGASPDADFIREALANVKTVVYLSTTLNTGHAHGLGKDTFILPVLARDEEQQATTQESMFNFVRVSDGGPKRLEGPRSEVSILTDIADRAMGSSGPLNWRKLASHDEIRKLIAEFIPGMEQVKEVGATKREFEIPGRVLHEPKFKTPSGKAHFHPDPIPVPLDLGENQVLLMTVRSEGQFNTVVYEEQDVYRGQERRDVVLMSAATISRLGLKPEMRVDVFNDCGRMRCMLVREFSIADGCAAMYYPEANVLVPRTIGPTFEDAGVQVGRGSSRTVQRSAYRTGKPACR